MADIFQYINAMYCIRDAQFNPIHDNKVIDTYDINAVHKALIKKAHDDGNTNALIFQNELFFTRKVGDINNNEIKRFIATNNTWDVMILNPSEDLALLPVSTYTHVHRVNSTGFNINNVYLISNRFMLKMKNNTLSNVETYYYDNTFVDSANGPNTQIRHVIVGKLTNIQVLKDDQIIYSWLHYPITL